MTAFRPRLRWIGPLAVLLVATALRVWGLGTPDRLVFDEIYYVRDALSQLTHGYSTTWPTASTDLLGDAAHAFSDQANAMAHPPLGKWMIGLGFLLLGSDTAWAWRISAAVVGIATVGLTMRLAWLISRSTPMATLAGLFLAVDGVHVVMSRVGLLDVFLTLLIVVGSICIWRDQLGRGTLTHSAWWRPWLLAAGAAFGTAAAVKWSGLTALAAFLLLVTARDLSRRIRAAAPSRGARLSASLGALGQAGMTAAFALPAAFITYLASWLGWILHPGAQHRQPGEPWWASLWQWHVDAFAWHTNLTAAHPYQAAPLGWPLGLRPTLMMWEYSEPGTGCPWAGGCVTEISPIPNLIVTWGGALALLLLCWVLAHAAWIRVRGARPGASTHLRIGAPRSPGLWAIAFVVTGFLSGWLPWVLTVSRSAVFQFYAVAFAPFSALALALVLGAFAARRPAVPVLALAGVQLDPSTEAVRGRRLAVAIVAASALALGLVFFPMWAAVPMPEWFWRAHIWLPGWR